MKRQSRAQQLTRVLLSAALGGVLGVALVVSVASADNIQCPHNPSGAVTCQGTERDDNITGTANYDNIAAHGNCDHVIGHPVGDIIAGNGGQDRSKLDCNGGLWGNDGNDGVYGGDDEDDLHGDDGDDYLEGGPSNGDWCYGGAGQDRFDASCEFQFQ